MRRALELYCAYLRSQRAVDPDFDRLLEIIRDRRTVSLLTGHDDRRRLLVAIEHYLAYAKVRPVSDADDFRQLAEEIREMDPQ